MLNPYSQGWQSAGNSVPTNGRPSIFGALPFTSLDALPAFFSFRFTSFSPTIMNCTVVGPQSRPYFRITTDVPVIGVSVFQNSNGQNIALVQWHRHPEVEIRNIVTRQRTSEMLSLSLDQRLVTSQFEAQVYSATPEILGRISRGQGTVTLEITGEAIRLGILEPAVVATFLLQCGRNID
ncbi:hypothetical protein B0H17DRAFT_927853 [Mycena rosella]|uniref:Uncharacterized protein n=1 Tax=Mycena rosella TaxID=1033263 RepID=A0AAD7DU22_MYCRO|nr:hypothetical protein B0H17DRAFT_927853 [Mycena rosella]